jgi:hypothetical protein
VRVVKNETFEKIIRILRIKLKIIRIAYMYSKCIDCRINIYTPAAGAAGIVLINRKFTM